MKKEFRRLIAMILTAAMLVSLVPVSVFAENGDQTTEEETAEVSVITELSEPQQEPEETETFPEPETEAEPVAEPETEQAADPETEPEQEPEPETEPELQEAEGGPQEENFVDFAVYGALNLSIYRTTDGGYEAVVNNSDDPALQRIDFPAFIDWNGQRVPVVRIREFAFQFRPDLAVITFPEDSCLRSIGENAFRATSLRELQLPASLESIEEMAFYQSFLSELQFAEDGALTEIGSSAFSETQLTELSFPASLEVIGNFAFNEAVFLTKVTYPADSHLRILGEGAFGNARALTEMDPIPASVQEIGGWAFGNNGMEELTFCPGSQLKNVGNWFGTEAVLKRITIPASAETIEICAFSTVTTLEAVTFEENSCLKQIGDSAFSGCTSLSTLTPIPAAVETIGKAAFFSCPLEALLFEPGGSLQFVDQWFSEASCLKYVQIPAAAQYIAEASFLNAQQLESVEIEAGSRMKTIGAFAFRNSGLKSFTVPASVETIGELAFYMDSEGGSRLETLTFEQDSHLRSIAHDAFQFAKLKELVMPNSLEYIGRAAFYGNKLTRVTFTPGTNIRTIEEICFHENPLEAFYLNTAEVLELGDYFVPQTETTVYLPPASPMIQELMINRSMKVELLTNTVSVEVLDDSGNALTGGYTAYWYAAETDQLVGTGPAFLLEDGASALDYYCLVVLEDALLKQWYAPEAAAAEDGTTVRVVLKPMGHVQLTGTVCREDGTPAANAEIAVTASYSSTCQEVFSAVTGEDGGFALEIPNTAAAMRIRAAGYYSRTDTVLTGPTEEKVLSTGNIILYVLPDANIALTVLRVPAARPNQTVTTEKINDLNAFTFLLTGPDGTLLEGNRLENSTLYLGEAAAAFAGQTVTLTVLSTDSVLSADPISVALDENGTGKAEVRMKENGRFAADTITGAAPALILVFDAAGNRISTDTARSSWESIALADGSYHVVFLEQQNYFRDFASLAQLAEAGLTEDVDYLRIEAEISGSTVCVLPEADVPGLDTARFDRTVKEDTWVRLNKSSAPVGSTAALRISFALKPEVAAQMQEKMLYIPLDPSVIYIPGSATLDGVLCTQLQFHADSNTLAVPIAADSGLFRCLVTPNTNGTVTFSPYLSYRQETEEGSRTGIQPLGTAVLAAPVLTFTMPATTRTQTVPVSGVAAPNSTVVLYEMDNEVGRTETNAAGKWSTRITLRRSNSAGGHFILAKVTDAYGYTHTSETKCVKWSSGYTSVSHVLMKNFAHAEEYTLWTFDGNTAAVAPQVDDIFADDLRKRLGEVQGTPPAGYERNKPIFNNTEELTSQLNRGYYNFNPDFPSFTFMVFFESDDMEAMIAKNPHVYVKSVGVGGAVKTIKATYDANSGCWIGSGEVTRETAPNTLTIAFNQPEQQEQEDFVLDRELLDADIQHRDDITAMGTDLLSDSYDVVNAKHTSTLNFARFEPKDGSNSGFTIKTTLEPAGRMSAAGFLEQKISDGTSYQVYYAESGARSFEYCQQQDGVVVHYEIVFDEPVVEGWDSSDGTAADWEIADLLQTIASNPGMDVLDYLAGEWGKNLPAFKPILNKIVPAINLLLLKGTLDKLTKQCNQYIWDLEQQIVTLQSYLDGKNACNGEPWLDSNQRAQIEAQIDALRQEMTSLQNEVAREKMRLAMMSIAGIVSSVGLSVINGWGGLIIGAGTSALFAVITNRMENFAYDTMASNYYDISMKTTDLLRQAADMRAANAAGAEKCVGCICTNCECEHEPEDPTDDEIPSDEMPNIQDPSGYVYEAVPENRMEGVTASIYQRIDELDAAGEVVSSQWELWNAAAYEQIQNQITGADGTFGWDVPMGNWKVVFQKDGYAQTESDVMEVPPEWTDVNIGMTALAAPVLNGLRAYTTGVELTFSQYMLPETVNSETVQISADGEQLSGIWSACDAQPDGQGRMLANRFRFTPDTMLPDGVSVKASVCGAVSYNTQEASQAVMTGEAKAPITTLTAENVPESVYTEREGELYFTLGKAGRGQTVTVTNLTPSAVLLQTEPVVADANGRFCLHVYGVMPGTAIVKLALPEYGLELEQSFRVTACEHEWGTAKILTHPTAAADGLMEETCRNCGRTRTTEMLREDYDLSNAEVILSRTDFISNGKTQKPGVTVRMHGKTLDSKCYTLAFTAAVKPGTVTITIKAKSGYGWFGQTTAAYQIREIEKAVNKSLSAPTAYAEYASDGMTVSWTEVPDAEGYLVYSGSAVAAMIDTPDTLLWKDPAANVNGTAYQYKVCAYTVGAAGISAGPASAVVSTLVLTAPSITSFTDTGKGLTVNWSKNSKATGYYVYRNGERAAVIKSAGTTSWVDKEARGNNAAYTYGVQAYKTSGKTVITSQISVPQQARYLEAPQFTGSSIAVSGTALTWTKNAGASGYYIYRDGKLVKTISSPAVLSWTDPEHLVSGKTYSYQISAYKQVSGVIFSSARSAAWKAVYMGKPDLNLTSSAKGTVLRWSKEAKVTGYRIYREDTLVKTIKSAGTVTWTDTGAKDNGAAYTYRVEAYKNSGKTVLVSPSSARKTVHFLTGITLSAPVNRAEGIFLSWTANPAADSYILYRDGKPVQTVGADQLEWTDTAPAHGSLSSYQLCAVLNGSESPLTASRAVYRLEAPAAPVLTRGVKGVQLTWQKDPSVTGYSIYRDGKLVKKISSAKTVSWLDTAAKVTGQTYTYELVLYRTGKGITSQSEASESTSICFVAAPAAPSLKKTAEGIQISWKAVSGADGYQVFRKAAGETQYTMIAEVSNLTFTDTAPAPGTACSYLLRARLGSLTSADSPAKSIKR